ncbi:MAG: hypothetical protein QNJ98_17645 [Planctomycetota bacterium]|nr:hypothetical protein [Planctomycetota bacterium]
MIRPTRVPSLLLVPLLALLPFGCGGGGGGDYDPSTQGGTGAPVDVPAGPGELPGQPTPPAPGGSTPPGTTTSQPRVPRNATPPIGLTWKIGYTENAPLSTLQIIYGKVLSLNSALWNATEGQVYIYEVVITDNVGPGTTTSGWTLNSSTITTTDLDILVWPKSSWDLSGVAGFVIWSSPPQFGRTGLIMALPSDASTNTWLHEAGHLIWDLSWSVSFGLEDEYLDGVQDISCVMESTNTPWRFCSAANHTHQTSQPRACWAQILLDYANFTHTDQDKASTSPWTTKVTYNDSP